MMIWLMLGGVLGALFVVGSFAGNLFGIRTMLEEDIRSALESEDVWDAFQRRREDVWPFDPVKDDPEVDVWDAFSAPQDAVPEFLRGEEGDSRA